MAKSSNAGTNTLLILALLFPLGAANFLLNLVLTVMYMPSLAASISTTLDTAVRIFVPFTMYVAGLVFSILLLVRKPKEKYTDTNPVTVITITALVLNSILVVSGLIFIYSAYFTTAAA